MEHLSIEKKVYEFVKSKKRYVRGGEIEDAAHGWGYLAETAKRKARHLAEVGKFITREVNGKVEYTAITDNPAKASLGRIFNQPNLL